MRTVRIGAPQVLGRARGSAAVAVEGAGELVVL
jgi:hypothetical protein